MTPKNIAIAPELFERISEEARKDSVSPDDLASELLGTVLEMRKLAEARDTKRRDLVDYGARQAEKLGITEEDVDRLIHESRAEQRAR